MSINVLNRRVHTLTLLTMAVSLGLFGCSDNDNFNGNIDDDTSDSTYAADIQRTEFGIPHITAKNYKGLGYGVGYAFAEDNICSLAREIVIAKGESMRYLGAEGNENSDVFYTWYNSPERRSGFLGAQDPEVIDAVKGYAAGYNRYLRDTGLFFPIDPGANASIGGMVATRASGTNAVRYGSMKDVVLALEVVTASGDIVRTGTRAKKSAAGYDLTRLMVGSEGTLGIVTEVTLKLFGISECIGSGICHFPTIEDACQAVMLTIQMCLPIARIELLDAMQIKACNQYANLNLTETPTLFVEFHGTEASVAEQAQIFTDIIEEFGGTDFAWDTNEAERKRLWQARHNAYHASSALRPEASALSTDACVPISRLSECVSATAKDIEASGMIGPIVGHVGDGNFHVLLLVDTNNPEEVATADGIISRLASRAIEMDGTCTGEHGIGQGKQKYMQQEHGNALLLMQAIKSAFDPKNILNPGKIWPETLLTI